MSGRLSTVMDMQEGQHKHKAGMRPVHWGMTGGEESGDAAAPAYADALPMPPRSSPPVRRASHS